MDYVLVTEDNAREVQAALAQSHYIAFDLETQGLDPWQHKVLLFAFKGEHTPVYLMLPHRYPQRNNYAEDILWDMFRDKVVLAHNAAFEYMFMKVQYPECDLCWSDTVRGYFDTALAEKVLTNGILTASADLGTVVKKYTGVTLPKELQKSWVDMSPLDMPTEEQLQYAAGDVAYLFDIMQAQIVRAKHEGLLRTLRLEMQVLPAFAEMQLAGFYLNLDKHQQVLAEYVEREALAREAAMTALQPLWEQALEKANAVRLALQTQAAADLEQYLHEQNIKRLSKDTPAEVRETVMALRKEVAKHKAKPAGPINLGSADQVLAALAEAGIRPKMVNPDGTVKASLDKNVLKEWQHEPLVRLYSAWVKPNKVVTTYGETLRAQVNPVTGRVHPHYNQIINSGRCSSSQPNGQNMPPDVRHCFEAEAGNTLIVADAKNQEGRLAAALSKDKNLLGVFLEGKDWHQMTAALAYPDKFASWQDVPKDSKERAGCKNANFSSIYGGTAHTLYARGYVPSLAIGEKLMEAVYTFAPTLRNWSLDVAQGALDDGYAVTVIGRKRYFRLPPRPAYSKEENSAYAAWKRVRGGIRRAAMNHPVQGSGADIMKQAMIFLLPRMQRIGGKQVAFVHDEIVYEVPLTHAAAAATMVAEEMERAAACFVTALPIPGDVHETKEWKK